MGAHWQRRLVVATAVVGLSAGLTYGVVQPQTYRAAATVVLLPAVPLSAAGGSPFSPAAQATTPNVTSEVALAKSAAVLVPAGQAVRPAVSRTELTKQVSATAIGGPVVKLQVSAPRGREALDLADAVTTSYIRAAGIQFREQADRLQTAALVASPSQLTASVEWGALGLIAGLACGILLSRVSRRRFARS